jgi:ADP-heptose:LPS heptosyltransferase
MAVTAGSGSPAPETFQTPQTELLPRSRRVLVVVYGHLSDTMAATPALRSLRAALPASRIDVLVLHSARPVLSRSPHVDSLIEWSDFQHKGTSRGRLEKGALLTTLGTRLRLHRYDATLVLHNGNRAMRLLAQVVGSPVRAGISDGGDSFTHPVPSPLEAESARQENARVLAALGIEEDGGPVELWTSVDEREAAEALVGPGRGPLVGIHAGADWSCQQWLPERFAEVASTLQRQAGARIVLTGSRSEASLEDQVARGMAEPPIRAAGRTTFGELVEVIRRLDLLVCVSSAASSIAAATGTPSVVLLGPEDGRYTGMLPERRRRVLQPGGRQPGGSWCELGRWGVLSGCESPICRGVGGLDALGAAEVSAAALEMLAARPALRRGAS